MNDFITEIKEDIKRERVEKIFHNYGKWIVAGSALIVLGVASGTWFKNANIAEQERVGTQYRAALAADPAEKQVKLDEIIAEGTDGYRTLAGFSKAKELAGQQQWDEAIASYDAIVEDASAERKARDLAHLMALSIEVNQGKDEDVIQKRFDALIGTNSVWEPSAREQKAMFLLEQGKKQEALVELTFLKESAQTPFTLKERVEKLLALLGDEA